MSTSDPNRPGGPDKAPAADEPTGSIEPTTPASDDSSSPRADSSKYSGFGIRISSRTFVSIAVITGRECPQ